MCLTIPAQVVSVKEGCSGSRIRNLIVEDFKGRKKVKALMIDDLKAGDWALYSFDTAVRKIAADDAREILELLEPKAGIDVTRLRNDFVNILKACHTRVLERKEIIRLLKTSDPI
jgi:hydrogenase assembly chaperone HypC/HupF